jgi:hypothetical protein
MDANHDIIILFLLYHSKIFGHLQLLEVFMLHFGNPQVSVFLHVKGPFCHVFFRSALNSSVGHVSFPGAPGAKTIGSHRPELSEWWTGQYKGKDGLVLR